VWPGFQTDEEEPVVWSVFTSGGAWPGDVRLPPSLFLKRVYDDIVFGMWRDEAGVCTVRSYRLSRP